MDISHLALKLKSLKLELFDDLLMYLVLIFLHAQSANLRSATTIKKKNELLISSFHILCKKKKG